MTVNGQEILQQYIKIKTDTTYIVRIELKLKFQTLTEPVIIGGPTKLMEICAAMHP